MARKKVKYQDGGFTFVAPKKSTKRTTNNNNKTADPSVRDAALAAKKTSNVVTNNDTNRISIKPKKYGGVTYGAGNGDTTPQKAGMTTMAKGGGLKGFMKGGSVLDPLMGKAYGGKAGKK